MRRKLTLFVMVLLLLAGGHFLVWRWAQQQLDEDFDAWAAAERAAGWTITSNPPQGGGWPLKATLTLPDLVVTGDAMTWRSARATLTVSLLHPGDLVLEAMGRQVLKFGDLPEVGFGADRLIGRMALDPAVPPTRATLEVAGLRSEPDGVTVAKLDGDLHWGGTAAMVSVRASGIGAPAGARWPFGPAVAELTVDATLDGPWPNEHDISKAAAAWRDGGGSLKLTHLAVIWGRLTASGTATVTLDGQLQPKGTGTVRIVDPEAALRALTDNGVIDSRAALATRALLALMTHAQANGGPPEVEIPLTLQNQRLSMGQVPLAKLPPLTVLSSPPQPPYTSR